ncbi:MAG TPA: phosphohydrolase, partial [Desulfomonilaceae bacterium]|nr:phosphohydrolase [Desulfomonilaceae bacterium]
KQAELKYQSTDAVHQEQEGPGVARVILEKLDAAEELIAEVCDIIGHHHHPRDEETANFKVVYDADLIVNLEEKQKKESIVSGHLKDVIETGFLTQSGRELARSVLLGENGKAAG